MIKLFILFLIAFMLGYYTKVETTFYHINCDTTKYSGFWDEPDTFKCVDTNIEIKEEHRFQVKWQLILLKLKLYKLKDVIFK